MIVLDVSVTIAVLDRGDALHARALQLLRDQVDDEFAMHAVTRAEVLVGPVRRGRLALAEGRLDALDLLTLDLTASDAPALAGLRAESRLKLPDCCVLLAAERVGGAVATFDERLARAAERRGLNVLS